MMEEQAVRMGYCELGVKWVGGEIEEVGGWVGGWVTYLTELLSPKAHKPSPPPSSSEKRVPP